MGFKDHFSGHADRYTRYRPHYPTALFKFLASVAPQRDRAWDCGTGNGQAAVALAQFFSSVVATDPSVRQLEQATLDARVRYVVAAAEACPLPDASVDLVTVAQAVHWFELPKFYAEVRRVCRPGGVLAVWAYQLATVSPEIDRVIFRLYDEILGAYWPPERRVVEVGYSTLDFPFAELPAPQFEMSPEWNLAELVGYLDTWSSAQRYRRQHARDPLDQVHEELRQAWGPPEQRRTVRWPLQLRIGRVHDREAAT